MGNLCLKCKACLDFLKPKQQKEQPIHQLVNLSKNPDVTEAKINPHQISFVNQSIEQISARDQMTEESNTSMEHHTQKQSLNYKSPVQKSPIPMSPPGIEKQAMLSQEESKMLEEPMTPISSKVIDLDDTNQNELLDMGEQAYEQLILELTDNEGYEEFQNDIENCRLRMKPYQYKKNQVTKVRFSMEFNSTIQKFINWADSKDISIDEDVYDYNIKRISEQLSVASIRLKKYTIITAKQFTYLKYFKQVDQNTVYILYKSVILDEDVQHGMERAQINLAGVEVKQVNDKLRIQGYSDINFNIRLQYSLTKRAFKEKILKDCSNFINLLKI